MDFHLIDYIQLEFKFKFHRFNVEQNESIITYQYYRNLKMFNVGRAN